MPHRRYVCILEETTTGTNYNHGKVVATVAQMENQFANEPGHNGDIFDQWVADGRIDHWYFVDSELHYRDIVPTFPPDWEPTSGVTAVYEATDFLLTMYYDINGVQGFAGPDPGWTILMIHSDDDRRPIIEQFGMPYDISEWTA